ncbi:MAG: hypothetical protein HYV33_00195 [Candidatus Kerfeldbacteria bacterium]|nr:hypothetical protein [Candidatus Kerfeldbacteria bacterium]
MITYHYMSIEHQMNRRVEIQEDPKLMELRAIVTEVAAQVRAGAGDEQRGRERWETFLAE